MSWYGVHIGVEKKDIRSKVHSLCPCKQCVYYFAYEFFISKYPANSEKCPRCNLTYEQIRRKFIKENIMSKQIVSSLEEKIERVNCYLERVMSGESSIYEKLNEMHHLTESCLQEIQRYEKENESK